MNPTIRRLWLAYRAAERDGYRPPALTALSCLVDAVWSTTDRDELALAVLTEHDRNPRTVVRHALIEQVLLPYLRDHIAEPRAIRWAIRLGRPDLLDAYAEHDLIGHSRRTGAIVRALALTGEPQWWRELVAARLGEVDHGTHHLDEGRGLVDGTIAEYVLQMCAAVAVVDQAPPGVIDDDTREELHELWSLLRDWVRYDAAGRPGADFPRWCRDQGSDHWVAHWTPARRRHFYYR